MTLTPHLIETSEAERIALYQRGWNDAARGDSAARGLPISYALGFTDYARNHPARYEVQ